MRYQWQFWVIIGTIALGSLVSIVIPLFYKRFFDLLTLADGLPKVVLVGELQHVILVVLGLNGLLWLFYRVASFVNNYFQPRVMADLANTCFDYLHGHSLGFFSNRFVGSLVRRVGRLVTAFEYVSDTFYWNLLQTFIRITASLVVIFLGFPRIGWAVFIWVVVYLAINYALALKKMTYDAASAAADSRVTGYLADTITNSSTVKLFSAQEFEGKGFRRHTDEQFMLTKRSWDFDATVEAVQFSFMMLLEFFVFWLAIGYWQQAQLGVGDFVLVQTYLIQMFDRLWDVGRTVRKLYQKLADAQEMTDILDQEHQVRDVPGTKALKVSAGQVCFNQVTFSYGGKRAALKDFDLCVQPGERVGVVGYSGAGKTTLVGLLLRFYDLTGGSITIDGSDISQVTQNSLRQSIGFVPQDPLLFHRTLFENIRYGRRGASEAEVLRAAKLAHCDEFISKLERGYDTFVGERGIKLSGGERQRVAIARAMLKNAPILVLDEATSSLDSYTESLIQEALAALMGGKTTIVIAHRLSTIMKLDRIVVVRNGTIHEMGTHAELLKQKTGLYRDLWQLQAGGFITS